MKIRSMIRVNEEKKEKKQEVESIYQAYLLLPNEVSLQVLVVVLLVG